MKENKSTIIGFVLMTLVFVGYMFYANYQGKKQQELQVENQIEQLAEQARGLWDKELSVYEVEGTEDQKAMFYTSLYHTMINPSIYMDVDGSYRGLDHNIHKADDFVNYTVFSLWDTYRAEHPFMNIIQPERSADMVKSMIRHQQQSVHGMLPIWSHMGNENWCMSGYHAVPVLADAIVKGVCQPTDEAFKAMVKTSTVPYYGGLAEYMELGYVPMDVVSTAASTTGPSTMLPSRPARRESQMNISRELSTTETSTTKRSVSHDLVTPTEASRRSSTFFRHMERASSRATHGTSHSMFRSM